MGVMGVLEITIPELHVELFNGKTNTFSYIDTEEAHLQLEHSLISLQKWEQKWHKPYFGSEEKTYEQLADYVRCMTLNVKNVNPKIYENIQPNEMKKITEYIEDPMTAAWFNDYSTIGPKTSSTETITAETIYYWMISLNIPLEYRKWHLNSLMTLIKFISIKNTPDDKKKMDPVAAARWRNKLNDERRKMYNSTG